MGENGDCNVSIQIVWGGTRRCKVVALIHLSSGSRQWRLPGQSLLPMPATSHRLSVGSHSRLVPGSQWTVCVGLCMPSDAARCSLAVQGYQCRHRKGCCSAHRHMCALRMPYPNTQVLELCIQPTNPVSRSMQVYALAAERITEASAADDGTSSGQRQSPPCWPAQAQIA